LTIDQSRTLLGKPSDSLRGKRDRAILALLIGCGLRRAELVGLRTGDFQVREEHCVIADLAGKGKHIRSVPVPSWAKRAVDEWTGAADITCGTIFRRVSRLDKIWGDGITPKAIWHVVKAAAKRADIKNLAPHDLRRTCARLCHLAGGELEQIQFLLGHASVQTTDVISAASKDSAKQCTTNSGWKTPDRVVIAPKPTYAHPALRSSISGLP
jgi:integrase